MIQFPARLIRNNCHFERSLSSSSRLLQSDFSLSDDVPTCAMTLCTLSTYGSTTSRAFREPCPACPRDAFTFQVKPFKCKEQRFDRSGAAVTCCCCRMQQRRGLSPVSSAGACRLAATRGRLRQLSDTKSYMLGVFTT